jgi:glycosyltransferase involved in cell wall biosynthesis
MKISICVSTYRRPEGIRRLLAGLDSLQLPEPQAHIEVVVVDNDPEVGVREVCNRAGSAIRWPVHYAVETRRGISHARNRALEMASDASDWIAIIDDDEVPHADWLVELLRVQRETDADVVTGPVIPHFEAAADGWIEAGGFFEPQRHPNGTSIPYAFTNNVIFRSSLLRDPSLEPAFAERYALTGGEDQHFFARVRRAGYRVHWADDALVTEWVPPSRTTAKWLVRRQFRIGNALACIRTELEPGFARQVGRWARALKEVALAVASFPQARMRGTVDWVRARQRAAFNLGMIWGLLGRSYEEYR